MAFWRKPLLILKKSKRFIKNLPIGYNQKGYGYKRKESKCNIYIGCCSKLWKRI
jgi:hypothetical protein